METKSNQILWRETAFRLLGVLAASVLIALNMKSFVQAGDLFPGGFTGLTRLIQRCALEFWGITLPFAPINLMFNAVPAFVSYKLVGKRFTFYSCLVIVVSSVLTDLLPVINITEDVLLISVFGGMLSGLSGGVALKARVTLSLIHI